MDAGQLARVNAPCIVMYQSLQNKPQACHQKSSTRLNTIHLQGQFKHLFSLQIILKSDHSGLQQLYLPHLNKTKDSVHLLLPQQSQHHVYNTLYEHNGSLPVSFIRFPKTAVQYCSPSKFHRMHEETRSSARQSMSQVINSKQAVTEMSCQHSPSAVVQVQQSHPGSSEPPPRPPRGCAVLGLEDSWPGCVEWIAGAAPVLSYICHKFVLHHLQPKLAA